MSHCYRKSLTIISVTMITSLVFTSPFASTNNKTSTIPSIQPCLATTSQPNWRPQWKFYSRNNLFNGRYLNFAYKNAFVFSPRRLRWTAYDSRGRAIRSGRASGGKGYCRDVRRACRTPVGHFRVRSKGGPGCRSSKYPLGRGGAPMPYCTFFRGNYAIHGSYDLPRYNASHGCIRVSPKAARWLSKNFLRIGTRVIVLPY